MGRLNAYGALAPRLDGDLASEVRDLQASTCPHGDGRVRLLGDPESGDRRQGHEHAGSLSSLAPRAGERRRLAQELKFTPCFLCKMLVQIWVRRVGGERALRVSDRPVDDPQVLLDHADRSGVEPVAIARERLLERCHGGRGAWVQLRPTYR